MKLTVQEIETGKWKTKHPDFAFNFVIEELDKKLHNRLQIPKYLIYYNGFFIRAKGSLKEAVSVIRCMSERELKKLLAYTQLPKQETPEHCTNP